MAAAGAAFGAALAGDARDGGVRARPARPAAPPVPGPGANCGGSSTFYWPVDIVYVQTWISVHSTKEHRRVSSFIIGAALERRR